MKATFYHTRRNTRLKRVHEGSGTSTAFFAWSMTRPVGLAIQYSNRHVQKYLVCLATCMLSSCRKVNNSPSLTFVRISRKISRHQSQRKKSKVVFHTSVCWTIAAAGFFFFAPFFLQYMHPYPIDTSSHSDLHRRDKTPRPTEMKPRPIPSVMFAASAAIT